MMSIIETILFFMVLIKVLHFLKSNRQRANKKNAWDF